MSHNLLMYLVGKVAKRVARKLECGSRGAVLGGALFGGCVGAGIGHGIMVAAESDDRWYLVFPLGMSLSLVGAMLAAHVFPTQASTIQSFVNADRPSAGSDSSQRTDERGAAASVGDVDDEDGLSLVLATFGTFVALIPFLWLASRGAPDPAREKDVQAEIEKLGPLVLRKMPDGRVVFTLKVWALLEGRWQATETEDKLEFREGCEFIRESDGKTVTGGFQLVRADRIRLSRDDRGVPEFTSWHIRFSDDGQLVMTDEGTGEVRRYTRSDEKAPVGLEAPKRLPAAK